MQNTSRHRILDALEMISNQIALASHSQELINNIHQDLLKEVETDQGNDEGSALQDMIDKVEKEKEILNQSIDLRRKMMNEILNTFESYDKDQRCKWKHALYVRCTAVEVSYANRGNSALEHVALLAYEQMISITCQILKIEGIEKCGRCMVDKLT